MTVWTSDTCGCSFEWTDVDDPTAPGGKRPGPIVEAWKVCAAHAPLQVTPEPQLPPFGDRSERFAGARADAAHTAWRRAHASIGPVALRENQAKNEAVGAALAALPRLRKARDDDGVEAADDVTVEFDYSGPPANRKITVRIRKGGQPLTPGERAQVAAAHTNQRIPTTFG